MNSLMDNYGLPSSDGQFGFFDLSCPSKFLGRYFPAATVAIIKNLQLFLEKIFIFLNWKKSNLNFELQMSN